MGEPILMAEECIPRRPNTGDFAVWDIDNGKIVLWIVVDGDPAELHVGSVRAGSKTRRPADAEVLLRIWDGGFVFDDWYWNYVLETFGLDYVFVEQPHVQPRELSYAQAFHRHQIDRYYAKTRERGIQPLFLRKNTARHARSRLGAPKKDPMALADWWSTDTDAFHLARFLAMEPHFDNYGVGYARSDAEVYVATQREERLQPIRRRIDKRINAIRFNQDRVPSWSRPRFGVPEQVTRALAVIIDELDDGDLSWNRTKVTFGFSGQTTSGRGRGMLARSEVCHQHGGKDSFVVSYGWGAVRDEFRRLLAMHRGEQAHPAPLVPLPDRDRNLVAATTVPIWKPSELELWG